MKRKIGDLDEYTINYSLALRRQIEDYYDYTYDFDDLDLDIKVEEVEIVSVLSRCMGTLRTNAEIWLSVGVYVDAYTGESDCIEELELACVAICQVNPKEKTLTILDADIAA